MLRVIMNIVDIQHQHFCIAFSSASGEGLCATTGRNPANFNGSAVVGPIAATYVEK